MLHCLVSTHCCRHIQNRVGPTQGCPVACRDYRQTSSVTQMLANLHWRPLDQRHIDSRLVSIPASEYLIPNRRESKFIHPLAYLYKLRTINTAFPPELSYTGTQGCPVACRDYRQTSSVTKMLANLHWRPLDQRHIDSCLVSIPASEYLIHNRRESKFIHPLAYLYKLRTINTAFPPELSYTGTPSQLALSCSLPWHSLVVLCAWWCMCPLTGFPQALETMENLENH